MKGVARFYRASPVTIRRRIANLLAEVPPADHVIGGVRWWLRSTLAHYPIALHVRLAPPTVDGQLKAIEAVRTALAAVGQAVGTEAPDAPSGQLAPETHE
jgi:hypothetical protein